MLEITTAKKPQNKVKVDGFVYSVRKPGAGESYFLSQAKRNIKKLGDRVEKKTATEQEQEQFEKLSTKALKVCTTLFDALGDEAAQDYLDRLEADTLFEVIEQVYSELNDAEQADDGAAKAKEAVPTT